jgi:hypothetical protein
MSAWGKSDNDSSSGLVTLAAPAITFNAATGHAAGVYTSAGHPFQLGDPVVYANGGGTSVVGLTSGSTYYVTNVTANTFALAATEAKALHNDPTIVASTDGVGASHTFTLPLALGRGTLTGDGDVEFETENAVGQMVRVGNQEMIITAIASETSATVINANPGTTLTAFTDQDYRVIEKPKSIASVATTDFESTQVFGVRLNEIHGDQDGGYVSAIALQTAGVAKYVEVPVVTITGGTEGGIAEGTAVITAGAVSTITVTDNGNGYETVPTVAVETPRLTIPSTMFNTNDTITYSANHLLVTGDAVNFIIGTGDRPHFDAVTVNADTGAFNLSTEEVTSAAHPYITGDYVRYNNGGGTSPGGLTSGNYYFIVKTGANTFKLAATYAHAVATSPTIIGLSGSPAGTGHTFTAHLTNDKPFYIIKTGDTTFKLARTAALATAGTSVDITYVGTDGSDRKMFLTSGAPVFKAALGVNQGVDNAESGAVAHTGWVRRKVLTGAHAGRIQYEVLVAMSKNGITSDAGDDIEFPED